MRPPEPMAEMAPSGSNGGPSGFPEPPIPISPPAQSDDTGSSSTSPAPATSGTPGGETTQAPTPPNLRRLANGALAWVDPFPVPEPERAPEPPPLRDPRRAELERIWRMDRRRSRVPPSIAWTLDPEFGHGEERGWRRIMDSFRYGETAAEFARRVAAGHAAAHAARNLFRARLPGKWNAWSA